MRRQIGRFLALSGLLLIALTTLVPLPYQAEAARHTPLWCLVCGQRGGVDVLNNLLLFVPFSAGLALLGLPIRWVVLAGALMSLTIETLQYFVIPGRDPSLSDVLTNSLGSLAGGILAARYRLLLWPDRIRAGRLLLVCALVWWGVQAGTAALLRAWAPPGELRGAWARVIPGRPVFDGTVTSAFVSGVAVTGDSLPLDAALRERISTGRIHLELGLTTGSNTSLWSPIFEVLGRSGSVLSVEAIGRDLIIQFPARALAWRLRPPALELPAALPPETAARAQLSAGARGDTLWAAWTSGATGQRAQQVLGPSLGWGLLVPFHYAYGSEVPWLTGLWLIGWMIPVGYWSAWGGMGRHRLPWYLLIPLVGLGFVPHLMGYPAVPWSEWLAGAIGIGLGWAGHHCATKLQARCDSPSTNESS